uniref:EGF-like domain-containing protein n=1 Tax=Meloidogyne floridensis TaxID=298350 RepID=A0A915NJF6_9BILA
MSRKFNFLLLIILSFYFIYSAKPSTNPKKKQAVVSDDDPNLYIFNENFAAVMARGIPLPRLYRVLFTRLITQWNYSSSLMNLTSFNHVRSRLAKLGKIALYLRLYRTWIYSPASGHRGFHRYNPYPPVTFHPYIYGNCSNPNNFMLFFNYFDFSTSYFLCFLTKNRVSFLARLPFCSYGFEEHQIHEWPAMAFRQFEDSPELWRFGRNISLDPIDHFSNQIDFECADVSFCPDPCCGRNSTRFFREGDTHNYAFDDDDIFATFNDSIQNYTKKMTRNERKHGWCAHSTCSLKGKRHIDYSETKEYFEDKKLQEEIQKRNRKNKNIKNGTEGEDQIIKILLRRETSTHYYLEEPFNDDFLGIMENRWNLSCACVFPNNSIDHSKLYRFDVLECVDVNECIFEECPYPEQCVNMVDRYVCACPPGYYRQKPEITNEKIVKNEKEEGKKNEGTCVKIYYK